MGLFNPPFLSRHLSDSTNIGVPEQVVWDSLVPRPLPLALGWFPLYLLVYD